jgi:hypothetical protein
MSFREAWIARAVSRRGGAMTDIPLQKTAKTARRGPGAAVQKGVGRLNTTKEAAFGRHCIGQQLSTGLDTVLHRQRPQRGSPRRRMHNAKEHKGARLRICMSYFLVESSSPEIHPESCPYIIRDLAPVIKLFAGSVVLGQNIGMHPSRRQLRYSEKTAYNETERCCAISIGDSGQKCRAIGSS